MTAAEKKIFLSFVKRYDKTRHSYVMNNFTASYIIALRDCFCAYAVATELVFSARNVNEKTISFRTSAVLGEFTRMIFEELFQKTKETR